MKCFEQHQVRQLSQINKNDININRTCQTHSNNLINFYCKTCSINLCDQCLLIHPTTQHEIEKNPFEQISSDLNDKINQIDKIRLNALANLDHQLTSLQHDYDKAKIQIDLAYSQYQQILNDVYVIFIYFIFNFKINFYLF